MSQLLGVVLEQVEDDFDFAALQFVLHHFLDDFFAGRRDAAALEIDFQVAVVVGFEGDEKRKILEVESSLGKSGHAFHGSHYNIHFRELQIVQRIVKPAFFQQFAVVAAFLDLAVLDDQDAVGFDDGAQAVGDDEGGAVFHHFGHGLLDQLFRFRVQRGGGFVENEDLRFFQHGPGDGDALALAVGQEDAALADHGLVLQRQFGDEIGGAGDGGGAAGCRPCV